MITSISDQFDALSALLHPGTQMQVSAVNTVQVVATYRHAIEPLFKTKRQQNQLQSLTLRGGLLPSWRSSGFVNSRLMTQ